jgi:hypothetical protein
MRALSILTLFLIFGCATTKTNAQNKNTVFPYKKYQISHGECFSSDSLEFMGIGNNLYRGSDNELYFLVSYCAEGCTYFIHDIYSECDEIDDGLYGYYRPKCSRSQLSNIIDIATFEDLGNGNYKDKNNDYYWQGMADGGKLNYWSRRKAHEK